MSPARAAGVQSGVNVGYCRPRRTARTVRVISSRHLPLVEYLNELRGPEDRRTQGEGDLRQERGLRVCGPPGDIVGETNPAGKVEGKKEETWYDKLAG